MTKRQWNSLSQFRKVEIKIQCVSKMDPGRSAESQPILPLSLLVEVAGNPQHFLAARNLTPKSAAISTSHFSTCLHLLKGV
jgi:hypothetical protein